MNYRWIIVYLNMWRIAPVYFLASKSKFSEEFNADLDIWTSKNSRNNSKFKMLNFGFNMIDTKEYRNVVLNRLHRNPISFCIVRLLFKPLETLYINMPPENIGGRIILSAWICNCNCG